MSMRVGDGNESNNRSAVPDFKEGVVMLRVSYIKPWE